MFGKQLKSAKKNKLLEIIAVGKVTQNSLNIVPLGDIFEKTEFFSALKQKSVSDEDYETSYYLWKILKMRNHSDMNNLYHVQDIISLCEIIVNRFQLMQDKYRFNPRKSNSASSLSGCKERDISKIIIDLRTNNENVELFEKTLTGGFSCVNTRLSFDTEILLPNVEKPDKDDWKDYGYKVAYNLKLEGEEKYNTKRVISKILKLDKNNQYGYATTKPFPTGGIKKHKPPDWRKLNLMLETVDLDDPVGNLFVVDIFYDYENANPKQKLYNEIFLPIIEKQKNYRCNERSVYQLIELYSETDKGAPRSYCPMPKAHATLFSKKFQPLYLEHLNILIGRAGRKVTKIYAHYSFEQERFKKNFILMNQRSRQTAKNAVEKDFFKLLNNANFGNDCRNNIDNCTFVPLFGELNEVTYLKKYYDMFDKNIAKFVSSDLLKQDAEVQYNDALMQLSKDDPYREIKLAALINKKTKV